MKKISPYCHNDTSLRINNLKIQENIDLLEDRFEDASEVIFEKSKILSIKVKDNAEDFYHGWKKFVFKDSIINIAVGMIVAASFKNTVNSLVVDIIMPLIIGFGVKANVHDLFVVLVDGENKPENKTYITLEEAKKDGAVTVNYGSFINIFFDLIFVTLCLYMSLKVIHKVKNNVKKNIKKLLSNKEICDDKTKDENINKE